jgi:hypothetical protein
MKYLGTHSSDIDCPAGTSKSAAGRTLVARRSWVPADMGSILDEKRECGGANK